MKVCKVCGEEKPFSEFYKGKRMKDGHRNECKSCNKKWREENAEKIKNYMKENSQKRKEYTKNYRKENSQKIKKYMKKWSEENKQRKNEYQKNKYKTDPLFKLKCNIRGMVNRAIKTKRTEEIIGCSYKHLKLHIESQFTEGMSWENYGKFGWHIDHKNPLSWYELTNEEEVAKANHYSNLQPMWAEENLSKGNRFAS